MAAIDLDRYFARIGFAGAATADLDFLHAVHRLHPEAIPFENLSTLIREPVPLDLEALQRKLIDARRGGYCFEQNRLFASMLEAVGFRVTTLAARVIWNLPAGAFNPRTHMVMLVESGDRAFLSDVGFGGLTLTAPLALVPDRVQATPHDRFRLLVRGAEYELQVQFGTGAGADEAWRGMYRFDLQAQLPIDYEMANHYVASFPGSIFLSRLMAGRAFDAGRHSLDNTELTTYVGGRPSEKRSLTSVAELKTALSEVFGIDLPDSSRLDTALAAVLDKSG